MTRSTRRGITITGLLLAAIAGCGSDAQRGSSGARYALSSVVIDADGNRTTYVQTIDALDGPFDNKTAIELPGNGVVMTNGRDILVGLAESPQWVRYSVGPDGVIAESGRLDLSATGAGAIDYGNAIIDDETAVSVFSGAAVAVIWNPKTMTTKGEIDLSGLLKDGYDMEVWTTIVHDGLVYIPNRYSDWVGSRIFPNVSITVIDPKTMSIVGVAQDDRCASGGKVVFDAAGYGYVMGDGRTYSIQMFANAAGTPAPQNCLLRIPPGTTQFDPNFFYPIPSLTGGVDAITELDTATQGSGVGFAKMFYPDKLPPDVKPVDFTFWDEPAHKMWQLDLGDTPTAHEVTGAPFASVGFSTIALAGHLFVGEGSDPAVSEVYEIDPIANTETHRFTMDGYFYGLYDLGE